MDERGHLVVRVQAAGTGQHPDGGAFEGSCLGTDPSALYPECMAIRSDAEKSHDSRPKAPYLRGKASAAGDELGGRKLVSAGGGAT